MPKQNQQPGGGGLFSKYQGEQVSQLPPGYLEAASQQGAMYANLGSQIAGYMIKGKEFGLKEKEIEAANAANNVGVKKNEIAERKNDIEAGKKEDDSATKYLTAKTTAMKELYGMHDTSIQTVDARISGLELSLKENADPDSKKPKLSKSEAASIAGQIVALREKRAGHQASLDEITSSLKALPPTLSEYRATEASAAAKEQAKRQGSAAMSAVKEAGPEIAEPYLNAVKPIIQSAPISLFTDYISNMFGGKK